MTKCRPPSFAAMLLALGTVLMAGCASLTPRESAVPEDRPWVGPNERAVEFYGRGSDHLVYWKTSRVWRYHGKELWQYDLWYPTTTRFLERQNVQFPESYSLRVVCLEPVVVIASPAPSSSHFTGGTLVPYHAEVTWFSPTLGIGPSVPERSGDDFWIPTPWGRLVGQRSGDMWTVVTEAK